MIQNDNKRLRLRLLERACASYERELQQYIYALTRNDSFAMEEIYQNTMLSALRGIYNLREEHKIKDWIFAIAREESKRYYAALTEDKAGRQHVTDHECETESTFISDFTQSVEDRVSVAFLISGLKEEEQRLYVLHYYYGFPFKKISEMLNMNYNTVRSMHGRGMAKMRKRL